MNTPLPKFSFSLPVYNEEQRIAGCLQSILGQDYPRDKIEILVVDGGSSDRTKEIAAGFECVRLLDNPLKLADFGAKLSAREASGELFVVFAADNGLAGKDWLKTAGGIFAAYPRLSAFWGKMVAAKGDPALNRYYALIQNDPLSFFVNQNLRRYLRKARRQEIQGRAVYLFEVMADAPLIWGANGLVYRTEAVRGIITGAGFVADNDVFQAMVEAGKNQVAYSPEVHIYHHHVRRVSDWVKKWKRNYLAHFLSKAKERNLRWAFHKGFGWRLCLWVIYSGIPVFSLLHSLYLAARDRRICWLFHPLVSFAQLATYGCLTIFTPQGRNFLKERLLQR